jgi:hypothetical protein
LAARVATNINLAHPRQQKSKARWFSPIAALFPARAPAVPKTQKKIEAAVHRLPGHILDVHLALAFGNVVESKRESREMLEVRATLEHVAAVRCSL